MKLRFSNPSHLVDLNFVPETAYVKEGTGALHFGALTRHTEIAESDVAGVVPIIHDCATGIADAQAESRHHRRLSGGSIPSGDWAAVLLTLKTDIHCLSPRGERTIPLPEFITDAYTTALHPDELVREVVVKVPEKVSGGAYLAFKRSAPVYPTASAAVQLTVEGEICKDAMIVMGCVGLMPVRATEAEAVLRGRTVSMPLVRSVRKIVHDLEPRYGIEP